MLKRTTLRCSSTRRHNITTVEDPRGYWGQINIFFVRKLWVDNSITLEISTGLLDGINFGFFYSRIRGFAVLVIVELLALFVANQLSGVLFGGVAALEDGNSYR